MVEILSQIAKKKALSIAKKGFELGHNIPKSRQNPLIKPCFKDMFFIAEIKRASPSNAHIGEINSVVNLAKEYLNGGASAISILCEEAHFSGSLEDLMDVKNAYPNTCVLRKDFIQYPQEIDVSYRAGADMILLIVAMFIDENDGFKNFKKIYEECLKYGITALIEVHNEKEIDFIAPLKPKIVGINARNLTTFEIDIIAACVLRKKLPKDTKVIFESGITSNHLSFVIGSLGFDGLLCGSYLVAHNHPTSALQGLKNAFKIGRKKQVRFYQNIFDIFASNSPAIKICGINNLDNALQVADSNIDMLGFIMIKQSPRYISHKDIIHIAKALERLYPHILRVGVVNDDKNALNLGKELLSLGHLDALQLHGLTSPNMFAKCDLRNALFCFYPVQNIALMGDFMRDFEGTFCLVDAKSTLGGGAGKCIDIEVLKSLRLDYLCVAGGINAKNIKDILTLKPKMLDINSGVESAPAKKDKNKLLEILTILNRA